MARWLAYQDATSVPRPNVPMSAGSASAEMIATLPRRSAAKRRARVVIERSNRVSKEPLLWWSPDAAVLLTYV
jgi:hypothetical protein